MKDNKMMTMYPPIGVDNLILADFELEQFGIEGKKFEKAKKELIKLTNPLTGL